MHRLIVASSVYQQAMKHPRETEFEVIDAENRYLWVRDPVRLEAEVLRDSVLSVSGQLNREAGGPPFFPQVDDAIMLRAPTWWDPSALKERNRRTIYMIRYRSLELPFLRAFDVASPNESCPVREGTTVTPQVFVLFNSKFVYEQSRVMAARIRAEVGGEPGRQVERAFQLAFQRRPSDREHEKCIAFLDQSSDSVAVTGDGTTSDTFAGNTSEDRLTDLCLVLLNSNEFVFLE